MRDTSDDRESTELLRRALLWLGAGYAITADLILLGLPVLPATFMWHDGLKIAALAAVLLGIAGLFSPMWRDVALQRHKAILWTALALFSVVGCVMWATCEPLWWFAEEPGLLVHISLIGAIMSIITAIWPRRGWRRWLRRKIDRLPFEWRSRLYGSHYGDY